MICGIMVYADYRVNQEIGLKKKASDRQAGESGGNAAHFRRAVDGFDGITEIEEMLRIAARSAAEVEDKAAGHHIFQETVLRFTEINVAC